MEDWQKTLIGTLSGFITGVLMEPIRFRIAAALKRSALKQDIYADLGRIQFALARFSDLLQRGGHNSDPSQKLEDPHAVLQEVSTDLFENARDTEKPALYSLPEYAAFKSLYDTAGRIQARLDGGTSDAELSTLANEFESTAERFMKEGILSPRRFSESTRVHRRRVAARYNRYYRR